MANERRCETCAEECPKAEMLHETAKGRMYATNEFIALQKKVDSGQLVEVIHCQNCKHCITEKLLCTHPKNRVFNTGINVSPKHFCSYGERRCK